MFNVQGKEFIFLLIVALVILGPEKLPEAVRKFGRTYAELKKMANGFQGELKQALDEPLREIKGTADALRQAANFDDPPKPRPVTPPVAQQPDGVSEVPRSTLNFGIPSDRPSGDEQ